MCSSLTGKDILNALIQLKNSANLTDIVENLCKNNEDSKTALLEAAKILLDAGVRFGCIVEEDNKYRAEYMIPKGEKIEGIELKNADEETAPHDVSLEKLKKAKTKTTKKLYGTTSISSDDNEGELNDYEDNCGPRSSRKRRSRSRNSSKRRSSRRRRRQS